VKKTSAIFVVLNLLLTAPGLAPYQAFAAGGTAYFGHARTTSQAPLKIASLSVSGHAPTVNGSNAPLDFKQPPNPYVSAASPVFGIPRTSRISGALRQEGILTALAKEQAGLSAVLSRPGLTAESAVSAAGTIVDGISADGQQFLPLGNLIGNTLLLVGFRSNLHHHLREPFKVAQEF
jgi:hypothetical protein